MTIQSAADVATISPYCEITGDLDLNAADGESLVLHLSTDTITKR